MAAQGRMKKVNNQGSATEWYQNPWAKIVGAISAAITIFSIGYSIGQFKMGIEHQIEISRLNQECNEKLQNHINTCREEKENETREMVNDLRKVVEGIGKGDVKHVR